ncbi:MAG: hypothetical protein E6Q35_02840 [Chryseobacterium cucumeris]|nr:MAG: hypothetical protein E6Q35_02840 [Chryseobacterium cucumeris]
MANTEQIKIQISGDTSTFQKDFNKAIKWAQQKGKTIFGKPQSSGQQNRPSPEELNRKATEAYKRQHSMTGYFNSGSTRAKQTIDMSSDMASLQRGGFYSAISSKVQFAKGAKDWLKGRYKDFKGTTDKDLGGKGLPGSGGLPGMGAGKGQNMTVNASTVIVNGGKGTFGQPTGGRYPDMGGRMGRDAPGPPAFGNQPEGGLKGASGRISTIAKALPMVGVGLAAVSGLMQLASSAGEQYAAGQERQAGTLGALGGHVGSTKVSQVMAGESWAERREGGQGFVANADIAQGMVSFGKESGRNVYSSSGKGNGSKSEAFAMFSASQAESLPAVMAIVGKFEQVMEDFGNGQKDFTDKMLGEMRAESHKAGFKNLKEMEFMKGIASQAGSMRGQGFMSDPMQFAKFVSSMGGMTNERKMSIGKTLDTSAAKGVFGGGLVGQLAMAAALEHGSGNFFKDQKRMETDPEFRAKMIREGLKKAGAEGTDEQRDAFGTIMKQHGYMSASEGSNYFTNTSQAKTEHDIRAKQNEALASQNIIEDVYQKVGQKPFQAAQNFAVDMARLSAKLEGVINATTTMVAKVEELTFKGLNPVVNGIESLMKSWVK